MSSKLAVVTSRPRRGDIGITVGAASPSPIFCSSRWSRTKHEWMNKCLCLFVCFVQIFKVSGVTNHRNVMLLEFSMSVRSRFSILISVIEHSITGLLVVSGYQQNILLEGAQVWAWSSTHRCRQAGYKDDLWRTSNSSPFQPFIIWIRGRSREIRESFLYATCNSQWIGLRVLLVGH